MASSARQDRVYHQDYIARIRYSNVLPPPPNHPKLLNIPNTGLASGHYTSAAYASRLAREQPLNIEADAELGMPIDLVGLPGVFDGDESCIQSLDQVPVHHSHDRALLKPLSALGKGNASSASVSFLRRTEYISSDQHRRAESALLSRDSKNTSQTNSARKRKRPENENENDPAVILRDVQAGFDLANPEHTSNGASGTTRKPSSSNNQDWEHPTHPSNPSLTLLSSYPLLPDTTAIPDSFFNMVLKFSTNPGTSSHAYDTRLDTAILRPLALTQSQIERYQAETAAFEAGQTAKPPPRPNYNYEFFLPQDVDPSATERVKRRFDMQDPERDTLLPSSQSSNHPDAATPDDADPNAIAYKRIREYQSYQQSGDPAQPFGDAVALALYDPASEAAARPRRQKAAYFYPVGQRTFVRPRHKSAKMAGDEDERVDVLKVSVTDPSEEDSAKRRELSEKAFVGGGGGAGNAAAVDVAVEA